MPYDFSIGLLTLFIIAIFFIALIYIMDMFYDGVNACTIKVMLNEITMTILALTIIFGASILLFYLTSGLGTIVIHLANLL